MTKKSFFRSPSLAAFVASPLLVASTTWILAHLQELIGGASDPSVRPYGIVFVMVIALVTVVGGRGPGLFTLVLSLLSTTFFLIEPKNSWRIAQPGEWVEVGALCLVGAMVTLAVDQARRARERVAHLLAVSEEARARLRAVMDTAPVGVLTCDANGTLDYANREAERIWGQPLARVGPDGWGRYRLLGEDGSPLAPGETGLARALAGEPGVTERRLLVEQPGANRRVPLEAYSTAVRGQAGSLLGALTILNDVTARRTAEAEEARLLGELTTSEERHRALFETVTLGVIYQRADGQILAANPAAARVLGLSLDQIQSRFARDGCWQTIREDGSDFPGDEYPSIRALQSGQVVSNVVMGVFRPADETFRWLDVSAVPQFRPGEQTPYQVYTIFEDISERKQAERTVRDSEERFRSLITATAQIIWTTSPDGRMKGEQAGWAAYTGQNYDAYQDLGWTDAVHEDDRANTIAAWSASVVAQRIFEIEHRVRGRDDVFRHFSARAVPVQEPDGTIREWVGVHADISARKEAEESAARLLLQAQARAERNLLLNRIGQAQRASHDPEQVQRIAVMELGRAVSADRCYLGTLDKVRRVRIGRDWRRLDLPTLQGEYRLSDFGIDFEAFFREGGAVAVSDVQTNPLAAPFAAAFEAAGVRSAISVPLYENDRLVAVLTVAMAVPRAWSESEVSLVEAVAAQTRTTMDLARLLRREHNIAERLQEALTPTIPAGVSGLDLDSYYKPALAEANVGGDFFDVFSVEKGCVALVVGDLSGKGLQAAAQIATVRNMLRFALYQGRTMAEAMNDLNDALAEHDLLQGFATLFVGIHDQGAGNLTFVSCGHEPALLRRRASGRIEGLEATGPVIGAFPGARYEERMVALSAGDALVIYTDGLSEAGRGENNFLEVAGLSQLLAAVETDAGAPRIKERIIQGVRAHAHDSLHDDMCLLVAVVAGK